ncbi:hypothetical protein [Tenacibaculum aiptasiae]|uniref:hypothetical protein n=1 Tax=Tenacibaculum aiptasiae TaxID=426481 RepID=UPI00232EA540|nr:hypothetical protein [Tenacibaculum aiptasiae]
MILTKNYLEKLQKNQLLDLAEFVVTENFKHHLQNNLPENYKNDVNAIYKEELKFYENSEVFTTRNEKGAIVGAIRVLKWNFIDVLPIQKIFGINPLLAINTPNVNDIYHIGRFAVNKDIRDFNLFKKLLVCVAKLICNHKGNMAFAECDSKLLRVLNLLGVKAMVIGESVNYLGSETIPIAMTFDGVIEFYNNNKHLVEAFSDKEYMISSSKEKTNNTSNTTIALSA